MAGYGDDVGFGAWLAGMGYTLPVGAPTAAVLRQRGSDYLDATYEPFWTGIRTDGITQERAWPRTDAKYHCVNSIDSDAIPIVIVNGSYRAAYLEAVTAGVLAGLVQTGARVKREKADVLEVEYMDDGAAKAGGAYGFVDPMIDGLVRIFICDDTGGFFFESVGP